eukprot:TRINITY_DN4698_c0_g1_i2.p1 TRINITY_DN4698_c0_g1~~TRINITY_DN4698_c0_g1_i2.p1  ORF type:complete len:580 (+),score=95.14 TRINITY_DN4698_c0_g1_i2:51-1742(+)
MNTILSFLSSEYSQNEDSSRNNNGSQNTPIAQRFYQGSVYLSERGLLHSAKWCAEHALSTTLNPNESFVAVNSTTVLDESELKYTLAKSYFDLKEYRRAAHVLIASNKPKNVFLRNYALYLAGEKRKEEEVAENKNQPRAVNAELKSIMQELQPFCFPQSNNSNIPPDGLCLWLYALVLKALNMLQQAREMFLNSVVLYPLNWSAWLDLSTLCTDIETLSNLKFPKNQGVLFETMLEFFIAHTTLELQDNTSALEKYSALHQKYPTSAYIISQKAIAHYNLREHEQGEQEFETIQKKDPFRLEGMDIYSNILYVRENRGKLSSLAVSASQIEKFCPETCCIVGNYYSLKGEHAKASMYFQRALKLSPKYLSAWTLMGHEYVQMANINAAVEAYRTAVDINPRDYRAWYGLGQTYQLLKMPLYSLYYYRRATTLRPYDPRMWCAMAGCYESLERIEDAIKCYERAENNKDAEGVGLIKLAKLYQEQGDFAKSFHYYKKNLKLKDEEQTESQETIDCLLFLATYCKNMGRYQEAEHYAERLLDFKGRENEEAKALLREIHSQRKK